MKTKMFLNFMLVLLLSISVVSIGCAKPVSPAPSAPTSAPSTEVYNWRLQNILGANEPMYTIFDDLLLPALERMTGGRIKITQYPGGTLIPSTELMGAVGKGTVEAGFTVSVYNTGIMPTASIEFNKPGGTDEFYKVSLWDKMTYPIFKRIWEKQNIYLLPGYAGGYYSMISKKPVRTLADLKGMKIRATGLFPNMFEAFGASTVPMPLGELYTGLTLGTVDAVSYAGPGEWLALKLGEPAKYITAPGLGGTDASVRFILNLDVWNSLPDDLKGALDVWARMLTVEIRTYREFENDRALKKLIDDYGVEVITLPDEDVAKWRETALKVIDEKIAPLSDDAAELARINKEVLDPKQHPHLNAIGKW